MQVFAGINKGNKNVQPLRLLQSQTSVYYMERETLKRLMLLTHMQARIFTKMHLTWEVLV